MASWKMWNQSGFGGRGTSSCTKERKRSSGWKKQQDLPQGRRRNFVFAHHRENKVGRSGRGKCGYVRCNWTVNGLEGEASNVADPGFLHRRMADGP